MWNQGSPGPLNFTRTAAKAASPAAHGTAPFQGQPPACASELKWDDYMCKFTPPGTMAQIFEGNKIVGTILTMNGEL
jgi:hypothetical protein